MRTENRPAGDVNVDQGFSTAVAVSTGGVVRGVVRRVVRRVRLRGRLRVVLGVVFLTPVCVVLAGAFAGSCAPIEMLKPSVISETANNLFIQIPARIPRLYRLGALLVNLLLHAPRIIARMTQIRRPCKLSDKWNRLRSNYAERRTSLRSSAGRT